MQTHQTNTLGRNQTLSVVAALVALTGTACIEQEVILTVQEGSQVTLPVPSMDGTPQPMTNLSGSITSTANIPFDLAAVLRGEPIVGDIVVDDILIAGTSAEIATGIDTGTVCTSLDKSVPSTGTLTIDLGEGMARIQATANARIQVTNPDLRKLLGGNAALPAPVAIDSSVPVNIGDLLGVLNGVPLPIDVMQPFSAPVPAEIPVLGGKDITGNLHLVSDDEQPQGALLDECRTFLDGLEQETVNMANPPAMAVWPATTTPALTMADPPANM